LEIDREIKTLESTVNDYRSDMNSEMARLQRKKTFANKNLAGATWE
jgi:hypothetical protein